MITKIPTWKDTHDKLAKEHKLLLAEFEQYKLESIKWGVGDLINMNKNPSKQKINKTQEALEDMIHHHDCNYGITWETLEYYRKEYELPKFSGFSEV